MDLMGTENRVPRKEGEDRVHVCVCVYVVGVDGVITPHPPLTRPPPPYPLPTRTFHMKLWRAPTAPRYRVEVVGWVGSR